MTRKTRKRTDAPQALADRELDRASGGATVVRTDATADSDKDAFLAGLRGGTVAPSDDGTSSGGGRTTPAAF